MGGQACVLYGAAEFSRDLDLTVLASPENLARLCNALADLPAGGWDDPTIGLHLAGLEQLLGSLDRLVDSGKSVIVIEHHPAVMAPGWAADTRARNPWVRRDPILTRANPEGRFQVSSPAWVVQPSLTPRASQPFAPAQPTPCPSCVFPYSFWFRFSPPFWPPVRAATHRQSPARVRRRPVRATRPRRASRCAVSSATTIWGPTISWAR